MTIQLRWLPSQSASCLHAVEAMSRGADLVDDALTAALAEPAQLWLKEINASGIPAPLFWRHLIPLSSTIESNHQLLELSLQKAMGRAAVESRLPRLVPILTQLETALDKALPDLDEQLTLRAAPLKQQWEARGPGLMQVVAGLTDRNLVVPTADVILVHPVQGGGGAAHLLYNSVRIEGVVANPQESLPEVLRLGWMLAQLNVDVPIYSEAIRTDRLPRIASLALLPAILNAAETVELARYDSPTLALALSAWLNEPAPDDELPETLQAWWETYQESRPNWNIALGALDQMLG